MGETRYSCEESSCRGYWPAEALSLRAQHVSVQRLGLFLTLQDRQRLLERQVFSFLEEEQ